MAGPEAPSPAVRVDVATARAAVGRALARLGESLRGGGRGARDAAGLVRSVPSFVGRVGALALGSTTWVWCEVRPGTSSAVAGQLVLDLPEARYLCDVLDVGARRWCSRESAEGGPLVIGLPAVGDDAVVRVCKVRGKR